MGLIVFDAETFYDPKQGYSLNTMSTSEYVLDPRFKLLGFGVTTNKGTRYLHGDILLRAPTFRKALEESVIIAHNAHFDAAILAWHYGIRPKGWICTLQMARAKGVHMHNPRRSVSLENLCLQFGLGQKPPLTPNSTPEELAIRGGWDANATMELFKILNVGFPKEELRLIDMTIRQYTENVVMGDVAKLQELKTKIEAQKAQALTSLGITEEDLASSPKFQVILEQLGVEVPMKVSPKGNIIPAFAKGDEGMQELINHDNPIVATLAETRLQVKSTTDRTRADTFLRLQELHGSLPVFYNYWGTHPGRWSGGDGSNFANLKRGGVLRDCIMAPPGHLLIEADMKQIQARLAAWLAGQEDLLEAFAAKRDVYCEFGGDLFHRPITKADEFERFCAKFWVLGGWFGMGGNAGAAQLKAKIIAEKHPFTPPTPEEAALHVATLRERYHRMQPLWAQMEWMLAEPGREIGPLVMGENKVILPNGMAINYPGLRYEAYTGFNGKPKKGWRYQGREGWVELWGGKQTQNACLALERTLLAFFMLKLMPYWHIVMHTYDSLCLCIKETQLDSARAALTHVMTTPPAWCADLPLGVDIGWGKTYGECGDK